MFLQTEWLNTETPLGCSMAAALDAMAAKGHPESTQSEYVRIWRCLLKFATECGVNEMSSELADDFLTDFNTLEGTPGHCDKNFMPRARRAVRALQYFVVHEKWDPYHAYERPGAHGLPIMDLTNPKTPLEAVIGMALSTMKVQGYGRQTRCMYSRVWKNLLKFAAERDQTTMCAELGHQFLRAYETAGVRQYGSCPKNRMPRARCAVLSLISFAAEGVWKPFRPRKQAPTMPAGFTTEFSRYLVYLKEERHVCSATLKDRKRSAGAFLLYLQDKGVTTWEGLRAQYVEGFFMTQTHMAPISREKVASGIRDFLRFLFAQGTLNQNFALQVPHFRGFSDQHVPTIWTDDMIDALLSSINRGASKGKRDYAILLLACRLGMRTGDICSLTLESLHWDDARIEYVQGKTGGKVILPLTNEVGNALIDYLLHGRPSSDWREVFLRSRPPYRPISSSFSYVIRKYVQPSMTPFPNQRTGMHSLRHTLATRLLANGTSLETIAGVLGHASLNTTRIYAKVDVSQLRTAAIDPEELTHA